MRVLYVASEAYPLAKTGGLGDVARALPSALARKGVDARLLLPGYPSALKGLIGGRVEAILDGVMGVPVGRIISGRLPGAGIPTWLVDAPSLYERPGGPYADAHGVQWPDNALRFAYLSHVAALVGLGLATDWRADVVHANDWHSGLLPLFLSRAEGPRPASVFTIHNLAFQGNFPLETARGLGVPDSHLTTDGCEFYGQASFLKAGVRFADRVTTVSPTYAEEALTPEFGFGLDGVLRARGTDFQGILNGIEEEVWNPAADPHLPASFGPKDISGKWICKAELQRELGLPLVREAPLIGFVSRLAHQKMADQLLEAVPWFARNGAQLALVAQGDPELEAAFADAGRRYPDNVAVRIDYQEALAHRLCAGVDVLLAPARFEPCGLTQLYGMRYGSVPVVRRTGGLADTVVNADRRTIARGTATGFSFENPTSYGMTSALQRAVRRYRQPLKWRRLQLQAMARNFSWDASAEKYLSLYCSVTGMAPPSTPIVVDLSDDETAIAS
jgi:starch synthase